MKQQHTNPSTNTTQRRTPMTKLNKELQTGKPITTLYQDGLDINHHRNRYNQRYNNTHPVTIIKQIKQSINYKTTQYTENFINKWNFPPSTDYIPKQAIKNQAFKSQSWKQLFNNTRLLIVIDYPATITKSDNGFQTINKPKVPYLYYQLINAVLKGPSKDFPIKTRTIILQDYHTLETTIIKPGTTFDEIYTDLTSKILIDPIPNYIIEPDNIPEELTELANLYDIDIPTRNLITYSTYQQPHGNTYTNMYPRQYTTEDQLKELKELINLYIKYDIITPEKTAELKLQQELKQQYLDNLNHDLSNLK